MKAFSISRCAFGIVFGIIFAGLAAFMLFMFVRAEFQSLGAADYIETEATIVEIRILKEDIYQSRQGYDYSLTLSYTLSVKADNGGNRALLGGEEFSATTNKPKIPDTAYNNFFGGKTSGEKLTICYNKENPDEFIVDSKENIRNNNILSYCFIAFISLFVIAGIWMTVTHIKMLAKESKK